MAIVNTTEAATAILRERGYQFRGTHIEELAATNEDPKIVLSHTIYTKGKLVAAVEAAASLDPLFDGGYQMCSFSVFYDPKDVETVIANCQVARDYGFAGYIDGPDNQVNLSVGTLLTTEKWHRSLVGLEKIQGTAYGQIFVKDSYKSMEELLNATEL